MLPITEPFYARKVYFHCIKKYKVGPALQYFLIDFEQLNEISILTFLKNS